MPSTIDNVNQHLELSDPTASPREPSRRKTAASSSSNDVASPSPKKSSRVTVRQCNGYTGDGFNQLFRQCYFAKLQDHDALVNPLPSMFGLPECFQTSAGASALQFSTRQDGTWKLAAKGCLETFVAKGKRKLCLECSKYSKLSHRLIKEAADDGVSGIKRTSKVGLLKIASNQSM